MCHPDVAVLLASWFANRAGKLTGIYLTAIFGPTNYAGHSKKVSINAIILIAYGASAIIGPTTSTGFTTPQYIPAKVAIIFCLVVAIAAAAAEVRYVWENKRRDRAAAEVGDVGRVD